MCLTLTNAATVLDHRTPAGSVRGYTCTRHQAALISPGDLWRAVDGEYPRTAVLVRQHRDRITITDQYGVAFGYPSSEVIATAVPDAYGLSQKAGRTPRARGDPAASTAGTAQPPR